MKSMKSIKDTVHGLISIDNDLMKVVDTPIFQRLGKVKQLTSAEYVFPGARHTLIIISCIFNHFLAFLKMIKKS